MAQQGAHETLLHFRAVSAAAAASFLFGVLAYPGHLAVGVLHKALELILKRGICRLTHWHIVRRLLAAALRGSGTSAGLAASSGFLMLFFGRRRQRGLN